MIDSTFLAASEAARSIVFGEAFDSDSIFVFEEDIVASRWSIAISAFVGEIGELGSTKKKRYG
jgi:hypothetical protein